MGMDMGSFPFNEMEGRYISNGGFACLLCVPLFPSPTSTKQEIDTILTKHPITPTL